MKKRDLFILSSLTLFQSLTSFAEVTKIELGKHPVPAQVQTWECGPISSAKMLWFYHNQDGSDCISSTCGNDYGKFRDACPKTVNGAKVGCQDVGPSPQALVRYMNTHSKKVKYVVQSSDTILDDAIGQILTGNPVLALIKVGQFNLLDRVPQQHRLLLSMILMGAQIQIPEMHYIMINGYDDETREFVVTDTDGQESLIGFDALKAQINWEIQMNAQHKALLQTALNTFGDKLEVEGHGNLKGLMEIRGNTLICADQNENAPVAVATPTAVATPSPARAPEMSPARQAAMLRMLNLGGTSSNNNANSNND